MHVKLSILARLPTTIAYSNTPVDNDDDAPRRGVVGDSSGGPAVASANDVGCGSGTVPSLHGVLCHPPPPSLSSSTTVRNDAVMTTQPGKAIL